MESAYVSLNQFLRQTFGTKVIKLSLNAALGCPNRQNGKTGCLFCSAGGSGDFAGEASSSITDQLHQQRALLSKKWPSAKYIAYFQAYTNTFAPVDVLRRLYEEALSFDGVVGLAIATRPDCLGEDVLTLLKGLSKRTFLWVELGFQTSNEKTAHFFGRGYENSVYDKAVADLARLGIPVVAHLIFGLPGETKEDMLQSVQYVCQRPLWGLKIHLLHVLRHTPLGNLYEQEPFPLLTQEEYLDLLCQALPLIPPHVVIHRLTGDGPKKDLIGPLWSANKKAVLNAMQKAFVDKNIRQGSGIFAKECKKTPKDAFLSCRNTGFDI